MSNNTIDFTEFNSAFILGGSNGIVFKCKEKIYKIFFRKNEDDINKDEEILKNLISVTNSVSDVLDNSKIKIIGYRRIPFNLLPKELQGRYIYWRGNTHGLNMDLEVFVISLNDLGTSIIQYISEYLIKGVQIPNFTIDEIFKICITLLYYNYSLFKNNITHGDIRLDNIVCNKDKLSRCIPIDFDYTNMREIAFKNIDEEYFKGKIYTKTTTGMVRFPPIFLEYKNKDVNHTKDDVQKYAEIYYNMYDQFRVKKRSIEELTKSIMEALAKDVKSNAYSFDIDTFSYGSMIIVFLKYVISPDLVENDHIIKLYNIIEKMASFSQMDRYTPFGAFFEIVLYALHNDIPLPELHKQNMIKDIINVLNQYKSYHPSLTFDTFEQNIKTWKNADETEKRINMLESEKKSMIDSENEKAFEILAKERIISIVTDNNSDIKQIIDKILSGVYLEDEITTEEWEKMREYVKYINYPCTAEYPQYQLLGAIVASKNKPDDMENLTPEYIQAGEKLKKLINSIKRLRPIVYYWLGVRCKHMPNYDPAELLKNMLYAAQHGCIIAIYYLAKNYEGDKQQYINGLETLKSHADYSKYSTIIDKYINKIKELQSTTTASYTTEEVKANQGGRRALRKRTHRKKRELRKRTLRKNRTKRRA